MGRRMTDEDRAYMAVAEADVLYLFGGTEGSGPHLKLVESIVRQLKAVRIAEREEALGRLVNRRNTHGT
jgi:hypothetical protein